MIRAFVNMIRAVVNMIRAFVNMIRAVVNMIRAFVRVLTLRNVPSLSLRIVKCSLGIGMFIMSKNKTAPRNSYFDICNEDRCIDIFFRRVYIHQGLHRLVGKMCVHPSRPP
jgi:hypothetical protein